MHFRPAALALRLAALVSAVAVLALVPTPAGAQMPTATVFIQARDDSGAPLKDVFVTITNQANQVKRTGETASDGSVAIGFLPAGTYTVSAALYNFRTEIIRDIHLEAAIKAVLNITLKPGAYADHVEVTANASTLRVGNSAVGQVFDSDTLLALPMADRDPR